MSALVTVRNRGTALAAAGLLALALACANTATTSSQAPAGAGEANADAGTIGTADEVQVAEVDQDPWAATEMSQPEASAAAASEAAPAAPATPATTLFGVVARDEGSGVIVELQADGSVDRSEAFVLENPLRVVVDLPGLKSQAAPQTDVKTALVGRVRVGQHADKVRIVIDAASGVTDLGTPSVGSQPTGLAVALAGATLPTTSVAAAPASEPTALAEAEAPASVRAAPESSLQHVTGVQLDASGERDRVVVTSDVPVEYVLMQPDAETTLVSIAGAEIAENATSRIVPEKPGVVSMVTAFQQPEAKTPEVRVVIQRAAGATSSVTQDGTNLVIDFPHGAQLAQPIPLLRGAGLASAPASLATSVQASAPAAIEELGSIDVLSEGGLTEGKVYTGRRVSLDFKDVDIDDVLRLIAEVSDLNVIAGEEVKGTVTIRLVDVPWDQALDVILLTKGLGFVRVGNVLRIAPSELLKTEEEARLQEKRAKEKLEDLVVKLQPVNYANVTEVAKMVKRLLSARGTVDLDKRTNTVILKDIPSVIDEATALIKAIDTQTPQVMIEAKIVEANLDFLREIGSTWGVGVNHTVDAFDPGSAADRNIGGDDFKLHNIPGIGGGPADNNVAIGNPITELATGAINIGAFLLDERFDVDLQLEAAESHGEGKVISSPRVVTLDNREASIEQGVSIPFQTFENGDAKLEFIDAVLSLKVTPHITADRSIIMQIEVARNAPDDSVQTPTGSPAIAKNEAQTETLVRDGQTLVIGGIYVVQQSERESRVPYLHKIPIVGNAFKNNSIRDKRQELLVCVTPRIVVNPELGS